MTGNKDAEAFDIDLGPTRAVPLPVLAPALAQADGLIPLDVPIQLGRYQLVGLIGKGGMAEVYLAKQDGPAGFQKTCVVKRIRRSLLEETRFVDMFLREARVAARLNHPNAVQIFELGEVDGEYFLAMEYLDGVSLHRAARRSWQAGESVPMEVALRAIADAALGLHHAHTLHGHDGRSTPLIHRDVSPDNIILTKNGVSKVLDFGIAKSTDVEEVTSTGEVKGKIPFMSPEQLEGLPLDGRSDLWSLGVTMYWLLTGKRPFDGNTEAMTIDRIMRKAPAPPRELNPLIPPRIEAMLLKLLEKDRSLRIASGAALSEEIVEILGPAAGYAPAAAFSVKVLTMPEAPQGQTISALTIIAARPETEWLKRQEQGGSLERLFPETTPAGAQPRSLHRIAAVESPSTGKTITGLQKQQPSSSRGRPLMVAAALGAVLAAAAAAFFVLRGTPDESLAAGAVPLPSSSALPPVAPPIAPPIAPPVAPPIAPPVAPPVAPQGVAEPVLPPPPAVEAAPVEPTVPAVPAAEPKAAAADSRIAVKASAPGRVTWKLNGKTLGRGTTTIKVARGVDSVTALDPETGGAIAVPIVGGVANLKAVATGRVEVRVKPWAEVVLGSKKLGTTPIDTVELPAGRYSMRFIGEEKQKTVTLEVKPGAVTVLNVDLR